MVYPCITRGNDPIAGMYGQPSSIPIRYHTARILHDRNKGAVVEGTQTGLDGHIDKTRGQHRIAVTTCAVNGPSGNFVKAFIRVPSAIMKIIGRTGCHDRVRQVIARPRFDYFAIEGRGAALYPHPTLVCNGLIKHTNDGLTTVSQCDQCTEVVEPRRESLGAVYGVENPNVLGINAHITKLFADDAVIRKLILYQPAKLGLYFSIDFGDGALVGFDDHITVSTKPRPNNIAAYISEAIRETN